MNKLFVFLLLVSCGKQVSINNSKLESTSSLSTASTTLKDGVLFRLESGDNIQYSGRSYAVSKYSSHQALTFIKSVSIGARVSVRFKGTVKDTQVTIEEISSL
jgi:hypothetical protein